MSATVFCLTLPYQSFLSQVHKFFTCISQIRASSPKQTPLELPVATGQIRRRSENVQRWRERREMANSVRAESGSSAPALFGSQSCTSIRETLLLVPRTTRISTPSIAFLRKAIPCIRPRGDYLSAFRTHKKPLPTSFTRNMSTRPTLLVLSSNFPDDLQEGQSNFSGHLATTYHSTLYSGT